MYPYFSSLVEKRSCIAPSIRKHRNFDRSLRRHKHCRRSPGGDTATLLRLRRVL